MKRVVGDLVKINPYQKTTGKIICSKSESDCNGFDYIVELNIVHPSKETIYTYNFDKENSQWWQYFNDQELDVLERNYDLVTR